MSDEKNRFEYQGELVRVDRFVTAKNKTILTLVFETGGQWPQWIAAKCFGRICEQAADWKPGIVLKVTGRLGGREYNGKIYPENIAEAVEVVGQRDLPMGATPDKEAEDPGSIPF